MRKFKVLFLPDQKTVEVAPDTTILTAAIAAGIYINSSCGGDGVCGRCKVVVKQGKVISQSSGRLTSQERSLGVYLACASQVASDLEVHIPPESRLTLEGLTQQQVQERLKRDYTPPEEIETSRSAALGFPFDPLVKKLHLQLQQPTLADTVSDLERVAREIRRAAGITVAHTGLSMIKGLSGLLRTSGWDVTAAVGQREGAWEIISIEPGDTAQRNFGVAFDIGTTTVSGQLIDLNSGAVLGSKATYNKQAAFGSDVITRIMYAKDTDGLEELHLAVADDINGMVQELCQEHSIGLNEIYSCVCAGNTTMIHLLLRIDPTYIRKDPYVPALNSPPVLRAQDAEIRINPRGLLYCVPGVSSYVGGDVTAGVLSSGLFSQEQLGVLIDIGTNGEVAVGNKEFLISSAASAGPAFEGSGVSCGMRAASGAIQKVTLSRQTLEASYSVLGKGKPLGICGSGYIDLIAELLRAGVLDRNGKIKEISHELVRATPEGREFVVVRQRDSGTGRDIVITEADIENLKRAKAAIYAGVSILLRHLGLAFGEVSIFFIAGGFGTYLDMDNAIYLGLLPDLERGKFAFIGNSSLAGSRQVLLSCQALAAAEGTARKMTYLELSVEPKYMDEYMAALFFPHTDLTLFPSVGH